MAASLLSHVFLLLLYFQSIQSQDLRESFYNEVRRLILNLSPIQYVNDKRNGAVPVEVAGRWGEGLQHYLGQMSGVSVNRMGQPVIFHRGPRTWHSNSFNRTFHFQLKDPINEDTVMLLDGPTGKIVDSWGSGIFYLPHGITVDASDNVWLTDVAMHQVLKWPANSSSPTLRLGEFFNPGSSKTQFCQPTSVAVASTKDFFVADGYCNNRIMKFSHKGTLMSIFPQDDEMPSLSIPHSISLIEEYDRLCVADRENMRVLCYGARLEREARLKSTENTPWVIQQPGLGRIFAIDTLGKYIYAVNGPTSPLPVQGFIMDLLSRRVIDRWYPITQPLVTPHDIAVSPAGDYLYVAQLSPNKLWKFKLEPKVGFDQEKK